MLLFSFHLLACLHSLGRRVALALVGLGIVTGSVHAQDQEGHLAPFQLSGAATQEAVGASQLVAVPGVDAAPFAWRVIGQRFGAYTPNLPAGEVTLTLGFVETEFDEADRRVFTIDANGVPLDARFDLWTAAHGKGKPFVYRAVISHIGGMLSVSLAGLGAPAVLSFVRATAADGTVLAYGQASMWDKPYRIAVKDARAHPFHPVHSGEVPFFNVDHSPVGAWATLVYGMEASGGLQAGTVRCADNTQAPHDGVIVAVKGSGRVRVMPFAVREEKTSPEETITAAEVHRRLGPCTDHWEIPQGASWTHFCPSWAMQDFATASVDERRRFALPATWMEFVLDNRTGTEETQLLFSLQQPAERATWPGFAGYQIGGLHALAVAQEASSDGSVDLLSADEAQAGFGIRGATTAFRLKAKPGKKTTMVVMVGTRMTATTTLPQVEDLHFMHADLFPEMKDVLSLAATLFPQAQERCRAVDERMQKAPINDERRFLASHALHSYRFNTLLFEGQTSHQPLWAVMEGECRLLNTLDLTVDHVFYELEMHPWTVRNVLDTYARNYSFSDQVAKPGETELHPGGLGFFHDMGTSLKFGNSQKGQAYSALMTQEELQNWILCAGLYWHATKDAAWLAANRGIFEKALASMENRDDVDPARRDGITSLRSVLGGHLERKEITTYDAMDHSLQQPIDSMYIGVKSFGSYLVLEKLFAALEQQDGGAKELALQSRTAASRTVNGLMSHWDPASRTFPANFSGATGSKIIPAIEGLVYPYRMGLRQELALDGPYGPFIARLKAHLESILVPGVCLDAKTGAWRLSSSSSTTWQSKVYLNQYISEEILGIRDERTGGAVDAAHVAYQVLGAPAVGWTCQITNDTLTAFGCRHYPRGVTSALWWLVAEKP